jgi:hypothetical protein
MSYRIFQLGHFLSQQPALDPTLNTRRSFIQHLLGVVVTLPVHDPTKFEISID